jgi:uncharacterized protein (TIGR03435 family)
MTLSIATLLVLLFSWSACTAQTAAPAGGRLEFDVASVRQNKSNDPQSTNYALFDGFVFSTISKADTAAPAGTLFSARNFSLLAYICFAYKLTATQFLAVRAWQLDFNEFVGPSTTPLPKWFYDDRFDIQARAAGHPTTDQVRLMMQALLAERFGLLVHKETRELPDFAMTLSKPGKLGPKLRPHPATDTCSSDSQVEGYPPQCGVIAHLAPSVAARSSFGGRSTTMQLLAASLPTQTGMATIPRPVVDETGLSGTYDFAMEWTQVAQDGTRSDATAPTFEQALKEQLGLRLESKKGPVEVLVIDHVEHPSAN